MTQTMEFSVWQLTQNMGSLKTETQDMLTQNEAYS